MSRVQPGRPGPSVSVVTPTLGRPDEVEGLLDNLNRQTQRPEELILVDGAPAHERATEEVVRRCSPGLSFRCRHIRRGGGTAIQRNVGIDAAQGDYIAFIDDDIRLETDFLARILQAFDEAGDLVGGIAGYITNVHLDPKTSTRWRWYRALRLFRTYEPGRYDFETGYPINRYLQPPHDGLREIDFMGAGCAVWRRDVFAGGLRFAEFFTDFGVLEDAHLALRAGRRWRLLECGKARCVHLRSTASRVDGRRIAWKSAVNYRYVFLDLVPRRGLRRELRFWRVQLFDLLRIVAYALRRREREAFATIAGKVTGILAASRLRPPAAAAAARSAPPVSWRSLPFDPATREAIERACRECPETEIVIGRIDNDGRLFGLYGEVPGLPNIPQSEFVPRYRFPLDVVIDGDAILVRKDFAGREDELLRESRALSRLSAAARVPAVTRVDQEACRLYKSYLYGCTLRDVLVEAGARILNVQTADDPELADLAPRERIEAVLARGTALLGSCFPAGFIRELELAMERIHGCRVAQLSLTFGNVMLDHEHRMPWLIDFDKSRCYRTRLHPGFLLRRRRDRETFARIYRRGG